MLNKPALMLKRPALTPLLLDTEAPVELLMAGQSILLGVWFATIIDSAAKYPSCAGLLRVMPIYWWGILLLIAGIGQACAIPFGSFRGRSFAASVSLMLRVFVLIMLFRGAPHDPAIPPHVGVVCFTGWAYLQRRRAWRTTLGK